MFSLMRRHFNFDDRRLIAAIITTVTLVGSYYLSGRSLTVVADALVAAAIVLVLAELVYRYWKAFMHHNQAVLRTLVVVSIALACGLMALFQDSSFGAVAWHWYSHLSHLRGWITVLVMLVGYSIACLKRKAQRQQQQAYVPRTTSTPVDFPV